MPGMLGESWASGEPVGGTAWDGHGENTPISQPGPPLLGTVPGGSRATGPVLAPCPVSRYASLLGAGDVGAWWGCAVGGWEPVASLPCRGAALGWGSGCLA